MFTRSRILAGMSVLLSVVLLCFVLAPMAHADGAAAWNQVTYVTVNAPVKIPGQVLSAGTYIFKLANPNSGRDVVNIFDKTTNKEVGFYFMATTYRWAIPYKAIVTLQERPVSSAPALYKWFYPGTHRGLKFLYAHPQSESMAALKHTSKFAAKG